MKMKKHFLFYLVPFLLSWNIQHISAQDFSENIEKLFSDFPAKTQDTLIIVENKGTKAPVKNHLSRFFMDFGGFGVSEYTDIVYGFNSSKYGLVQQYGGAQLRIGSSWYLVRGNFRGILRLTWLRAGIVVGDGVLFSFAPLHVGLGNNFRFSDSFSIDLLVSGGLLVKGPGIMDNYIELDYAAAPEIKFNIRNVVLGLEYSYKRDRKSSNWHYHYYGFGIGFKF